MYFLIWRDHYLKKNNDHSHHKQNIRSSETKSRILEKYKNYVMSHGNNSYKTETDMAIATMDSYTYGRSDMTNWKFMLRSCANCTSLIIPGKYLTISKTNMFPTIRFNVYGLVS